MNARPTKPWTRGLTEVRGPYYTPVGKRYLEDLLETMGDAIDSLKFAGGSFTLMPRSALQELIELAHRYDVRVSTGGFIERVVRNEGLEATAEVGIQFGAGGNTSTEELACHARCDRVATEPR